nr:acyl-CoA thioesterase [Enterocloster clostridioformis]
MPPCCIPGLLPEDGDQMGCVHHSNYIRWMEEARVNLMEQMGCGYKAMEASGIMSPVLEVHCQYRSMVIPI